MRIQTASLTQITIEDRYFYVRSGNTLILVLEKDGGLVVENFTANAAEFKAHQDSNRYLFTNEKKHELYKYRV